MKTKDIAILACLMALQVALSSFYIPVGPNLRIYFTFIIAMLTAIYYRWPVVMLYAIGEDLVSFFIFPSGAFFAGYTLTSVVSLLLYRLFLYKKQGLLNITLAKLSVNLIANIGLNSLWSHLLYSKAYLYYLSSSIIKNLVMLPIEVFIFYTVYKILKPLLDRYLK